MHGDELVKDNNFLFIIVFVMSSSREASFKNFLQVS